MGPRHKHAALAIVVSRICEVLFASATRSRGVARDCSVFCVYVSCARGGFTTHVADEIRKYVCLCVAVPSLGGWHDSGSTSRDADTDDSWTKNGACAFCCRKTMSRRKFY
jgi:hypothetical protein